MTSVKKRHLLGLGAALASALVLAATADARELVYGSWVGPKHELNAVALPPYFDAIDKATHGEIKWKLLAGGQLANGKATPVAVRDGLMDAGFGIAPYVPNLLPATNMIFNNYVFGDDIVAATGATMETVLLHCADCLAEHRKNNAIPLAGYDASPYIVMCRGMVKTIADLKGLKVRASGGGVGVMSMAGATPVAMSPADATVALERGTVDCVHGAGLWLRAYGYMDVVKSVIDYPLGISGPAMGFYVSRKTWYSMTPEQRRIHVQYAPMLIAKMVMEGERHGTEEALEAAKKQGIVVTTGGPEFDKLVADYDKIQRKRNVEAAEKFGVKDADAIMTALEASLKKWRGLTKDIGHDTVKFQALLKREIYDKIDPDKL
jgi:TRAP-type C4-dicarboxylate transport system substrate-binding protein